MIKYSQSLRNRDVLEPNDGIGRALAVLKNGWLIAFVATLAAALGMVYALRVAPVYEGSTVIQIKRNPALVADAVADSFAATEMEVLKSRSVLQPVVQGLQLNVRLDPVPPSVAAAIRTALTNDASRDRGAAPLWQAPPVRFDVPPALLGQAFLLTMGEGGNYTLLDDARGVSVAGRTGTLASQRSRYGDVGILVAPAALLPGSQYVLRRIPVAQAVEQLQHALVVSENAKQSNVIKVTLQGTDPLSISRTLGAIVDEYLRQRDQEQSGEASRLLASYDSQLEESRAALRQVDAHYARVLQRSGIVDPEAENQSLVQQSNALELQLAEAQQRKAELSGRVGDGHPAMEAVNRQIAELARSLGRNGARRDTLSLAGRELADVGRDKQSLGEGMIALFNQRSKLKAMISARQEEVRLLDRPETPLRAITPSLSMMALLSAFGGICLGVLASIVKNAVVKRKESHLPRLHAPRSRLVALTRGDTSRAS